MGTISILLLTLFLLRAIADKSRKFSLPITKTEGVLPAINPSFTNQHEEIQRPLKSNAEPTIHALTTDEHFYPRVYSVEAQTFLFYTTNISIGTPSQSFRVVVDIDWCDLFIPSSSCGSTSPRYCNPSNATYNASASSTYHDNGTITQIAYYPVFGYARLSEDVLTFADGLQVPGQVFHEIKYYGTDYDFNAGLFDGVLGLAIEKPWPRTERNILPSPFRSMVDHNLLDANMFSIVWPTAAREQGSLVFGGYDEDLLDGELVSHSLFPENTTKWQIEIESMAMMSSTAGGDKEVLVDHPFPDGKAFFMSSCPALALSYDLTESLLSHINHWGSGCFPYRVVDCDDVPNLPEIIIRFKGQNVTLRGEDYVRTLEAPKDCYDFEGVCHLMFDYLGDVEDQVILGMPFLEKVMGVWNWDEKTISFGKLKGE